MMHEQLPEDYYKRLGEIQAADFVLFELQLYLDTHPTDQEAMKQFNQYALYSRHLKHEFEQMYGTLTMFNPTDSNWSSGTAPWPWQV